MVATEERNIALGIRPSPAETQECGSRGPAASSTGSLGGRLLSLEIPAASLSTSAKTDIQIIAKVALALGLGTARKQTTLKRIAELREREWELEAKQREADKILSNLQDHIEGLNGMAETLTRLSAEFDEKQGKREQQIQNYKQCIEQANLKARNYEDELKRRKKDLRLLGYTPKIQHHELMLRSNIVQAKQEEMDQLSQKLSEVKDLPPDMQGARTVYNEATKRLLSLEAQFSEFFDNLQ